MNPGHPQAGFAHCRLAIIDLDDAATSRCGRRGNWVAFNGEIYNYLELRESSVRDRFRTQSRYRGHPARLSHVGRRLCRPPARHVRVRPLGRGSATLFCARDRFGIKPFYYARRHVLYFASEAKALLPFLPGSRPTSRA